VPSHSKCHCGYNHRLQHYYCSYDVHCTSQATAQRKATSPVCLQWSYNIVLHKLLHRGRLPVQSVFSDLTTLYFTSYCTEEGYQSSLSSVILQHCTSQATAQRKATSPVCLQWSYKSLDRQHGKAPRFLRDFQEPSAETVAPGKQLSNWLCLHRRRAGESRSPCQTVTIQLTNVSPNAITQTYSRLFLIQCITL